MAEGELKTVLGKMCLSLGDPAAGKLRAKLCRRTCPHDDTESHFKEGRKKTTAIFYMSLTYACPPFALNIISLLLLLHRCCNYAKCLDVGLMKASSLSPLLQTPAEQAKVRMHMVLQAAGRRMSSLYCGLLTSWSHLLLTVNKAANSITRQVMAIHQILKFKVQRC